MSSNAGPNRKHAYRTRWSATVSMIVSIIRTKRIAAIEAKRIVQQQRLNLQRDLPVCYQYLQCPLYTDEYIRYIHLCTKTPLQQYHTYIYLYLYIDITQQYSNLSYWPANMKIMAGISYLIYFAFDWRVVLDKLLLFVGERLRRRDVHDRRHSFIHCMTCFLSSTSHLRWLHYYSRL